MSFPGNFYRVRENNFNKDDNLPIDIQRDGRQISVLRAFRDFVGVTGPL